MLHRLILAQSSGFFEAGTSEAWTRAQARTQTSGLSDVDSQSTLLAGIAEDVESPGDFRKATFSSSRARERLQWKYELDWGNEEEVPMLVQKVGSLGSQLKSWSNCLSSLRRLRYSGVSLSRDLHQRQTSPTRRLVASFAQ